MKKKKRRDQNFLRAGTTKLTVRNIMSLDNILTDWIVHSIVIRVDFQWVRHDSATTYIGREVPYEIKIVNLKWSKIIILWYVYLRLRIWFIYGDLFPNLSQYVSDFVGSNVQHGLKVLVILDNDLIGRRHKIYYSASRRKSDNEDYYSKIVGPTWVAPNEVITNCKSWHNTYVWKVYVSGQ